MTSVQLIDARDEVVKAYKRIAEHFPRGVGRRGPDGSDLVRLRPGYTRYSAVLRSTD
jgi:hypothetical protein